MIRLQSSLSSYPVDIATAITLYCTVLF